MRGRRRASVWVALAALLLAVAAGLLLTERGRYLLIDAKRSIRVALGLPKNWDRPWNVDVRDYVAKPCPRGNPLVIVTGGQSNGSNSLSDPVDPGDPGGVFQFLDGQCYALRDPVLGASGRGGSLWTALGLSLHQKLGRPVVFINGAAGGTQLGDWLDTRSGYLARLARQAASARRQGLSPAFVIWVQGETDAVALVDPTDFVNQFRALIADADRSRVTVPATRWVLFRTTRCMARRGNGPDLDAAVTAFARAEPRVIAGPLASRLGAPYRRDGCHFNADGRDVLVSETTAILDKALRAPADPD